MNKSYDDALAPFIFDEGYVMLPYILPAIKQVVRYKDFSFFAKENFHVSILCVKKYAPLFAQKREIDEEEAISYLIEAVVAATQKYPISLIAFTDGIRIASKEERATLLVMCSFKHIDELFQEIRNTLNIDIPTQPTHITLYTLKDGKPIGISSQKELQTLTCPILDPELEEIKEAINYSQCNLLI
jgi:hypothetical protein